MICAMRWYFCKTPSIAQKMIPGVIWKGPPGGENPKVYLTFDDGPDRCSTWSLIESLEQTEIKGTFFLTGKNIKNSPRIVQALRSKGHAIGNHGFNHRNPWIMDGNAFHSDVFEGRRLSGSRLYRPPFGRLKWSQLKWVSQSNSVVMWTLMPGDFDTKVSTKDLLHRILKNAEDGTIIVLHDRKYCVEKFLPVLPELTGRLKENGYHFATLPNE